VLSENRECRDIEKSERSFDPRFQAPIKINVDRPAIERIERRTEDLRREGRGVLSLWQSEWKRLRDHIERNNI
jgi:hypothetical protein